MYVISLDADRMGYRLEGHEILHEAGADIISDGNPPGAVQVPGDGIPTVLMADRGTTGGYTKIATVISSDLGALAQAVPGQSVTFSAVTVEEAHQVLREREAILSAIGEPQSTVLGHGPRLSVLVDGKAFEVVNEDEEAISLLRPTSDSTSVRIRRARATVNGHTYEFRVEVQREE